MKIYTRINFIMYWVISVFILYYFPKIEEKLRFFLIFTLCYWAVLNFLVLLFINDDLIERRHYLLLESPLAIPELSLYDTNAIDMNYEKV